MSQHFQNLQIVFNIAMCGDWAGGVWGSSACAAKASSCNAFVANNPSAFQDAYWLINSLKVYQAGSGTSQASLVTAANVEPAQTTTTSIAASTTTTAAAAAASAGQGSGDNKASQPSTSNSNGAHPQSGTIIGESSSGAVTIPIGHREVVNVTMPRQRSGRGRRALTDWNEWLHI